MCSSDLAGTVIAARGEDAEGMFFIADGEVTIHMPRGAIRLTAGEFFGELALLRRVKRMGTVTAVTRTQLMIIDAIDFESLLNRDEMLKRRIIEIAEERLKGDWSEVTGELVQEELNETPQAQRPLGDPML